MDIHTALRLVLALSGGIFGILALSILKTIHTKSDEAMASFRLKPDQTITDFKILLAGEIFMLSGFLVYFIGGLLNYSTLANLGRFMAIVFSIAPIMTFYRWRRRF